MTPLAKRLMPLAEATARRLGCPCGDEPLVADGALGHLEHLIHELSHAVLLDVRVEPPWLDAAISTAISRDSLILMAAARLRGGLARDHWYPEAEAWAVEYQVWLRLRLPLVIEDALAAAEIQGVEKSDLLDMMDRERRRWRQVSRQVVAVLEKECLTTARSAP